MTLTTTTNHCSYSHFTVDVCDNILKEPKNLVILGYYPLLERPRELYTQYSRVLEYRLGDMNTLHRCIAATEQSKTEVKVFNTNTSLGDVVPSPDFCLATIHFSASSSALNSSTENPLIHTDVNIETRQFDYHHPGSKCP